MSDKAVREERRKRREVKAKGYTYSSVQKRLEREVMKLRRCIVTVVAMKRQL